MGTWVHWVIYGLSPTLAGLPEGVPSSPTLHDGSRQGLNAFRNIGYGGPCPPLGKAHRYFFRLYAMSEPLALAPGVSKAQVQGAMGERVLGTAELMGKYARA
jgi:Raf kinase inhibitor-like YbhB/YbcL family protein